MPTLENALETIKAKIAKYGKSAHCNPIFVSEEIRKNAIENKPDSAGRRKTRIALETYSPEAYSLWNELIESLMERLGHNPILVIDVLAVLIRSAGDEGIEIAKDNLAKVMDYEQELRRAKSERKAQRGKP